MSKIGISPTKKKATELGFLLTHPTLSMMYRISPTLLQAFLQYAYEIKDSSGQLLVTFDELIDRINRVKRPTNEAQLRGIQFEKALVTGIGEEHFPEKIINEMRALLPRNYRTQLPVQVTIGEVFVYGLVDVVGGNRAIDIKTTRRYQAPKFAQSAQNLYLLGLRKYGIEQLDYLITDFEQVYVESYEIKSYNFEPLMTDLERFVYFLEKNKPLIRDKKIFDEKPENNQLSLF
jgi:hypothetical protein